MPPITCHVLDTTRGKPAANVVVALYKIAELPENDNSNGELLVNNSAKPFALAETNSDGRVPTWIFDPKQDISSLGVVNQEWKELKPAVYKIRFQTGEYFKAISAQGEGNERTFFPFVDIIFTVANPPDAHYHIPLLLSNHSYSTYRGS